LGDTIERRRQIALFLPDAQNPYEQLCAREAQVSCAKLRFDLTVRFADGAPQVRDIHAAVTATGAQRPDVIVVMPVQETGLKALCEHALIDGIGWVFLNRLGWSLGRLQKAYPQSPVGVVAPDQLEVGRIQGRQLLALLPAGGDVLYVKGRMSNSSTSEREQGMQEVIGRSKVRLVATLDGSWTTVTSERATEAWLAGPTAHKIDAIACQNDLMALGAVNALARFRSAHGLVGRRIPVLGCDGLATVGKRLVDDGTLASTIVLPATTTRALSLVSHFFATRTQLPARAALPPEPYPNEMRTLGSWGTRAA
jgi:ABC-type sugar transport system substrate-binding protein